jgi:hypothetical protein
MLRRQGGAVCNTLVSVVGQEAHSDACRPDGHAIGYSRLN